MTEIQEASLLNQIKITEHWLEYDPKNFTMRTLIFLNLTEIHDPTNTNFPPKNYAGMVRRSPAVAPKLSLAGTPSQPCEPCCFAPLQEKKSGMEVRRSPEVPDVKLRFVGFIKFVSFNFGHVQLLKFALVMVWSYLIVILIRSSE